MKKDNMNKLIRTLFEASLVSARLEKEKEEEKIDAEVEIYASNINQLKDFINSKVWLDMSNSIGGMMEQIQLELMIAADIETVRRLQGTSTALLFLAELPESMLDEMITDKQIQKEEGNEDED